MAGKRVNLTAMAKAATAAKTPAAPASVEAGAPENRVEQAPVTLASPKRNRDLTDNGRTTAIHIPKEDLTLLRRVAVARADKEGGRASVSDVLRRLIDHHRAELEKEAGL